MDIPLIQKGSIRCVNRNTRSCVASELVYSESKFRKQSPEFFLFFFSYLFSYLQRRMHSFSAEFNSFPRSYMRGLRNLHVSPNVLWVVTSWGMRISAGGEGQHESKMYSSNRRWRFMWLWDLKVSIFLDIGSQMAVTLSALLDGSVLPHQKILVPCAHFS
jgi:hypothetical protein